MRRLRPAAAVTRTANTVAAPFRVRELKRNLHRKTQNQIHVPNPKT
jgi:hypothetical protein